MIVIFTNLDGILFDQDDSCLEAAQPALDLLKDLNVPLILCSGKTRAETEFWRERLGNRHPFIVENGGAVFIPNGYFYTRLQVPCRKDNYDVFEFGEPYLHLVEVLQVASQESQCRVLGFHQMSVEEVSQRCGISRERAALAKRREYDEPFEILGPGTRRLLRSIQKRQKRWTHFSRFFHIMGKNDKAHCVAQLMHFYQRFSREVLTVGFGDTLTDVRFLNQVDFPILMKSPAVSRLQREVPFGCVSEHAGPEGWNAAVLSILGANARLVGHSWFGGLGAETGGITLKGTGAVSRD